MAAMDLLGRRWALRVLYELRGGPLGFRELQARCDAMSSSVLAVRLGELEAAGLVERDGAERHELTTIGRELASALRPLSAWAVRWAGAQPRRAGPRRRA
jgi:DNA-binding HxlR family transcriptional regulator